MNDGFVVIIAFIAASVGTGLSECKHSNDKEIGAMEVYRGNTKLQYTIVDSVKVDSCVIFLNK